jgi:glucose/arabinose dehydrogenase
MVRTLPAVAVATALVACGSPHHTGDDGGGGDDDAQMIDAPQAIDARPPPSCADPAPFCTPQSGTGMQLQLITDQIPYPVAMASPKCDPRLFVLEQQAGEIRVIDGTLQSAPFLTIPVNVLGEEQGLLGLAFHPDFETNGRFFVLYVKDGGNDMRLAEYHADPGANVADTTEKVLLDINHPYANGNAGTLAFGNDGYLYLSLGDGGGNNNGAGYAQDPTVPLAKVLRFDVDSGDPYAIPPTNPWADGTDGIAEMFAWGLRNPWRISVDSATGDLWIGDVGEASYEEVDVIRNGTSGQNFGWAVFEGPMCFTDDPDGNLNCDHPENYAAPVMAYDRRSPATDGVVIGGVVYRGACMPDLDGRYFFGDYRNGMVRSFPASTSQIDFDSTTDHTADLDPTGVLAGHITSFGVDGYGEMYVTAIGAGSDGVYRIAHQ